jgi:ribulose-5-phosphate 4-epimerase/fuculose-1-phosphate aldolase
MGGAPTDTVAVDAVLSAPVEPAHASFAIHGRPHSPRQRWLVDGLRRALLAHGHPEDAEPHADTTVVINVVDHDHPRPFRRKASPTFVLAVVEAPAVPERIVHAAYPYLVRALANLCLYAVPEGDTLAAHFVTLEQGVYRSTVDPTVDEDGFFAELYSRVAPLALSRLVIDNEFDPDLPEELWNGDETTRQIGAAGKRLEALDLLPAPFPLQEMLSERDFRHVMRLYGIGGLSYGNVSSRHDSERFWMSASGVDKSDMRTVGEHIQFVKGFDPVRRVIRLSVPPHVKNPRRVSVDAIEHWMIYREHPEVGAILHVHAWMDGIPSTEINYPCGTIELARSVASLVRDAPEPGRAVVGQKNHGLTITGASLGEIFDRIEGRIVTQVPMS